MSTTENQGDEFDFGQDLNRDEWQDAGSAGFGDDGLADISFDQDPDLEELIQIYEPAGPEAPEPAEAEAPDSNTDDDLFGPAPSDNEADLFTVEPVNDQQRHQQFVNLQDIQTSKGTGTLTLPTQNLPPQTLTLPPQSLPPHPLYAYPQTASLSLPSAPPPPPPPSTLQPRVGYLGPNNPYGATAPYSRGGDSSSSNSSDNLSPRGRCRIRVYTNWSRPPSPVVNHGEVSVRLERIPPTDQHLNNGKIPRKKAGPKKDSKGQIDEQALIDEPLISPTDFYGLPLPRPAPWGPPNKNGSLPWSYNEHGELDPRVEFDDDDDEDDVKEDKSGTKERGNDRGRAQKKNDFLKFLLGPHPGKPAESFPNRQRLPGIPTLQNKIPGITLWISWMPAMFSSRFPKTPLKCRFRDCPVNNNTIRPGFPLVVLDERMNEEGDVVDPFHNAGYVHLYCLESCRDIIGLWDGPVDIRIDKRKFKREESNPFSLNTQKCPDMEAVVDAWWKCEYPKWVEAHKKGKSRPFQHATSLTYQLHEHDLDKDTSGRAKAREKRRGIDSSKHHGDLHVYQMLHNYKAAGLLDEDCNPVPGAAEKYDRMMNAKGGRRPSKKKTDELDAHEAERRDDRAFEHQANPTFTPQGTPRLAYPPVSAPEYRRAAQQPHHCPYSNAYPGQPPTFVSQIYQPGQRPPTFSPGAPPCGGQARESYREEIPTNPQYRHQQPRQPQYNIPAQIYARKRGRAVAEVEDQSLGSNPLEPAFRESAYKRRRQELVNPPVTLSEAIPMPNGLPSSETYLDLGAENSEASAVEYDTIPPNAGDGQFDIPPSYFNSEDGPFQNEQEPETAFYGELDQFEDPMSEIDVSNLDEMLKDFDGPSVDGQDEYPPDTKTSTSVEAAAPSPAATTVVKSASPAASPRGSPGGPAGSRHNL